MSIEGNDLWQVSIEIILLFKKTNFYKLKPLSHILITLSPNLP